MVKKKTAKSTTDTVKPAMEEPEWNVFKRLHASFYTRICKEAKHSHHLDGALRQAFNAGLRAGRNE